MPNIKLHNFEIEAGTLELVQLIQSLREMFMAEIYIDPPEEDAWETIYEEHNDNINPTYNLHMLIEYNQEKDIGIILIWLHEILPSGQWKIPDMPDVIKIPVFGKQESIRRSIELWDEYNKKEVIADFVEKYIAAKSQDKPTED